jgi:hypothetical protein
MRWLCVFVLAVAPFSGLSAAGEIPLRVPPYKVEEILVDSRGADGNARYPAFPALVALDDERVLVTFKDGSGHVNDPGAEVGTMTLNLRTGERREGPRLVPPRPYLFQCAEPVRMSDGRLAFFIDTQMIGPEPRHYRVPMRWAWSVDEGRKLSAPEVFPVVDGTGYGYPQEGLTVGGRTYVMLMSFGYLEGGKWTMDIVRTDDVGRTWSHVRDLAVELNVPGFNEGTMLPYGDGFLIASRDYVQHARLHEVDAEFRLRRQVDLTESSPWVQSYLGRPRLFRHEDAIYLIGRNWTRPDGAPGVRGADNPLGFRRAQQLCLFRIDPATLLPEDVWILDNAEESAVSDGYYAVVRTTGAGPDARLHVITYKGVGGAAPRLLRLEYRWSDFAR